MTAAMKPEAGDLVIQCVEASSGMHAVGVAPGPPQIVFDDYKRALIRARQVAARILVDVWVADDEQEFMLVARHRERRRRQHVDRSHR